MMKIGVAALAVALFKKVELRFRHVTKATGGAMSAITALDTSPLKRLEKAIDKDLDAIAQHRGLVVEATLSLAAHLKEARDEFPSDNTFGVWLDKNPRMRSFSKDDRAALLNFAKDLKLARIVFEKSGRTSLQHIWKKEGQKVYADNGLVEKIERKTRGPRVVRDYTKDEEKEEDEDQEEKEEIRTERTRTTTQLKVVEDVPWEEPQQPIDVKFEPTSNPIVQRFGDGEEHSLEEMSLALDVPTDELKNSLTIIRKNPNRHKANIKRGENGGWKIFRQPIAKIVSYHLIKTDLEPFIKTLRAAGQGDIADQLQTFLEKWGA